MMQQVSAAREGAPARRITVAKAKAAEVRVQVCLEGLIGAVVTATGGAEK